MERAEADRVLRELGLILAPDGAGTAGTHSEDKVGGTLSATGMLRRLLIVGRLSVDDLVFAAAAEAALAAAHRSVDSEASITKVNGTEEKVPPKNIAEEVSDVCKIAAEIVRDGSEQVTESNKPPQLSDDDVQINYRAPFGGGAFCMVYPVHLRDKQTGEFSVDKPPLALKKLRHAVLQDKYKSACKAALADLAHEAELLADLSHQNLIHLHGVSKDDADAGSTFIVLDPMADILESRLEKWSKSLGLFRSVTPHDTVIIRVREVALGIANGMEYLHSKNIIFRDLKPANVGFDRSGCVKIFDFGLARKGHRATGTAGTLRYMAPEVVKGGSYGSSADVFSFALLLWQIITSRVPYEEEIPESGLFAPEPIPDNKRPPLKYVESSELQAILESTWAQNPDERPAFHTVGMELQKFVDRSKVNEGSSCSRTGKEKDSSEPSGYGQNFLTEWMGGPDPDFYRWTLEAY